MESDPRSAERGICDQIDQPTQNWTIQNDLFNMQSLIIAVNQPTGDKTFQTVAK